MDWTGTDGVTNNYPITKTSEYGVMGCWNVTSMTIFSNITEIGMNAFSSCYALENVDFSKADKLEKIGGGAFGYCDKLAEIHLEYAKNLKIIDEAAFYNNGIEKVFLPDGVETIGKNALKRKDGQKTYVYGRTGSTAEEYCKNENAELFSDVCVFRDYEGVYLVHPDSWEEYYETGEGTKKVMIPSEIDGYTVTRLQQFYVANWEDARTII